MADKFTPEFALAEHRALFEKAIEVLKAKRLDYSGGDDPFANFRMSEMWDVEPWRGAAIRLTDKLSRLAQLTSGNGQGAVKDETMEDSVIDGLNYLVIFYLLWKESH